MFLTRIVIKFWFQGRRMDALKTTCEAGRLGAISVPIAVRICHRTLTVRELLGWIPGMLISFDEMATSDLTLTIGDRELGRGRAVKVGQAIALRLDHVGGR